MLKTKVIIAVLLLGFIIFPYRATATMQETSFTQIAKLTAPDSEELVYMGYDVAIDGDTLVAGVSRYQNFTGTVYIFERNQDGQDEWGLVKQLFDPEGGEYDVFGNAVAIEGDTIVVGERGIGDTALGRGAVLIFERNEGGPNNWGQVAKFTGITSSAQLGWSVSISGDTVAASAYRQDPDAAVHIFELDAGGPGYWGEVAEITLHDSTEWIEYGHAIDLDGDTLVVGAPIDDNGGYRLGSAYIYDRNEGGPNQWGFITKVSSGDGNSEFGYSVALDGDTLVVGAPERSYPGAAFTFERHEGGLNNWGLSDTLICSDTFARIGCGYSVAVQGNQILVGAPEESTNATKDGMVYIFEHLASDWELTGDITANDGDYEDYFGRAVAFDDEVLAVGATHDDEAAEGAGAVYVFYPTIIYTLYLPLVIR